MFKYLRLACLMIVSTMVLTVVAWSSEIDPEAQAAVVTYCANRDSFSQFVCTYRITRAEANSLDDALAGKWTNARSCDYRIVQDRNKTLHKSFGPGAPKLTESQREQLRKGNTIRVDATFDDNGYISDGSRGLNFAPVLQTASLYPEFAPYGGVPTTPFRSLRFDFPSSNPEKYSLIKSQVGQQSGVPVAVLRYASVKQPEYQRQFALDPARGYLPIEVATDIPNFPSQPAVRTFLRSAMECTAGRWFPERVTEVTVPQKPGNRYQVQEIAVLELNADVKPTSDDLAITIPAGTMINHQLADGKYFRLKQNEKVSPDQLPRLFQMLDEVKPNVLMDTAIPRGNPWGWWAWAGLAFGVLLAIGGLLMYFRRRRGLNYGS